MSRLVPLAALLLLACAANQDEEVIRSPSYDYPPRGPTTSDGRPIGADGRDIEETLEGGARVTPGGPEAPGWTVEDGKPKFDKEKVPGGRTSAGAEDEREPPSK